MVRLLRIGLCVLLVAWPGCARPTRAPQDSGPDAREASERQLEPGKEPVSAGTQAALTGRVLWRGPAPALPLLATGPSVRSVCGATVADNAVRVDGAGGVADAVVWVEAPAEAGLVPAALPPAVLDQRGCLYWPPVLAARAGGPLRIRNSDPLTHTVHAFGLGQSLFNVAMPLEHMELIRPLPPEPGVVDVRCDVHPWMRAVVRTFDHGHFTTTGADGHFRLSGLRVGDARLHAWHPRLGEASRPLRVGEGATPIELELGGTP